VDIHRDFQIVSNTVTGFGEAAIQLSTGNTLRRFDGVEISSNQIDAPAGQGPNGLTGIKIAQSGHGTDRWLGHAVLSGNRIADTIQDGIQRHGPTVPFIVTAGNPGHRATFEGDGDPNDVGVPAAPGSLYLRVDAAPATLYLKQPEQTQPAGSQYPPPAEGNLRFGALTSGDRRPGRLDLRCPTALSTDRHAQIPGDSTCRCRLFASVRFRRYPGLIGPLPS
jgi:hypothetical protein